MNEITRMIFNSTNDARRLEDEGKWVEASRAWENIHPSYLDNTYCKEQARTCRIIAEAIRRGDEFRALVQAFTEAHWDWSETKILIEAADSIQDRYKDKPVWELA